MLAARRLGPALSLALVTCAMTGVAKGGFLLPATSFSASPERIARGEVWLLVTSGLVVDRPLVISLLCFLALAALALWVCGRRVFWTAAVAGHVGSTLIVYTFIGLARLADPGVYERWIHAPDYGVSAVCSAWLGAVAAVSWRQGRGGRVRHAGIAVSCAAVGLFAYTVRPDLSVVSSEHVVAFAFGIVVGMPPALRRSSLAAIRRQIDRRGRRWALAPAAGAVLTVLVASGMASAAVADLKEQLLPPARTPVAACVAAWNTASGANLGTAVRAGSPASVAVAARTSSSSTGGCRFTFINRGHQATFRLVKRHDGRLTRLRVHPRRIAAETAVNATSLTGSRLRLMHPSLKRHR